MISAIKLATILISYLDILEKIDLLSNRRNYREIIPFYFKPIVKGKNEQEYSGH